MKATLNREACSKRVAITGIGIVCAAGLGVEETWRRLQTDPPTPSSFSVPGHHNSRIQFPLYRAPAYDLYELGIPPLCKRWIESDKLHDARDLHHLLASTALAISDASFDRQKFAEHTSVVVADEHPGVEQLCRGLMTFEGHVQANEDSKQRFSRLADEVFRLNTFLYPHYLARAFGFGGLCLFLNSACVSGLNALDVAAQQVRMGRTRVAIAAASDDPLSLSKYLWFNALGLYATDGILRPFDEQQTGTIFGDGGTTIVLEEFDSAVARGAKIYAEYLGSGFAQDGWRLNAPHPGLLRGRTALLAALKEAAVAPSSVDLVIPHATCTRLSDEYEARVLTETFSDGELPNVTAFKPFVGNNLGGSSMMEVALLLLSMVHETIPPTHGHQTKYKRYPIPLVSDWKKDVVEVGVKFTCAYAGYYGASVFYRPNSI